MDGDALTSVFVGLRQRLRRIATGILGDSDDAEDALQDAFCRLWNRRDLIAGSKDAEALSVTTVHNVCIDAVRRHSHSPTVSIDENRDLPDCIDDSPDEAKEREALLHRVEQIIDRRLTEQQQSIVRMRELEGMSFDEIASALDMQPAAVRVALSRARKAIRSGYLEMAR
ncbi:MAG: RNA polymerase sigma factor [Muribaculaceae bacterium]